MDALARSHTSGASAALDAAQRAVVELPATACGVVLGAAGTGKTTALVSRVCAVADAVGADRVSVLTASRPTATALRDRLGLAVQTATGGALAHSIVSFAFRIVRAATVHAGLEPPVLLTGSDEDLLIQGLLEGDAEDEAASRGRWPASLSAPTRGTPGFRTQVRAFLAECVTLGVDPDALAGLGRSEQRDVWTAMASFSREYLQVRSAMRSAHRDAAGLVREATSVLRAGDDAGVRDRVILIDDAQELTAGGVDLVLACRARGAAVLAFGDPDVGTGAFRGATPENFARLRGALGATHVFTQPHRGTGTIIDLYRGVVACIGTSGAAEHRLRPSGALQDASVRALLAASRGQEYDAIARALRERRLHDGVGWDQCAVIAHDASQVAALAGELAAREVPTRAAGSGEPLGVHTPVRDLLRVIELATRDGGDWTPDDAADALLSTVGSLDPVQLRRLRAALRHEELRGGGDRSGGELLCSALGNPLEFDLVDTSEARRAARLARAIAAVRAGHSRGDSVHELLWAVWQGSALEKPWATAARGTGPLAERAGRDLDAVVALFQAAKRFGERQDAASGDPLSFVRAILRSDVTQDRLGSTGTTPAVSVLTPAAALGVEFDTVVIAGVQDGVWPNTRPRGSLLDTWRLADALRRLPGEPVGDDQLDRRRTAMHDELRLFARAVSRARSQVIVTAVDDDDTGPSPFFELLPAAASADGRAEHPLSLRGLVVHHRRTLTDPRARGLPEVRARAAAQLALLADAHVAGADPAQWYGIAEPTTTAPLRDLEREDVRVSPSRLHTLETCALDWVIGDLGGDPGSTTAGLGTIIHAAMEHAPDGDEQSLWAQVEARWGELEFEAAWVDKATRREAQDLVRRLHLYLRRFEQSGGRLLDAEPHFQIPIALPGAEGHGAVLSGYIDRVELTAEGKVVIVDLKTGAAEPQTDTAVADNPQLGAYQLAHAAGAVGAGHDLGGAKLLVLRPTATTKDYAEPRQAPFDDDARAAFLGRIHAAVAVMRSGEFTAPYEKHCRDEHTHGLCRIHTIAAVSAP